MNANGTGAQTYLLRQKADSADHERASCPPTMIAAKFRCMNKELCAFILKGKKPALLKGGKLAPLCGVSKLVS
jgi:hypothetical protein